MRDPQRDEAAEQDEEEQLHAATLLSASAAAVRRNRPRGGRCRRLREDLPLRRD
jgi:hypothetical protein